MNIPYVSEDKRQRYEIKLTRSLNASHRFEGSYQEEAINQINNAFGAVLDLASLYTRETPLESFQIDYSGILSRALFVEGRFSLRRFSFFNSGASTADRIGGTLLLDAARGNLRYWSPTFCGVCGPGEKRDNDNEYVKATFFKSMRSAGSHNVVVGFDSFNDKRFANNHQSGSDYRIFGTTSIVRSADAQCGVSPGCVFPQFLPGSTILQYNPIFVESLGTNFRTNALFINDNGRWNEKLTFNLGLRWDKNHGVDSEGKVVARDGKFAPRIGVVWDLRGDGVWTFSGSYGVYTAALANSIANASSAAGNEATIQCSYMGPAVNPTTTAPTASLVGPPAAIQQVFDWCQPDSRGFCTAAAPSRSEVPGLSVRISDNLKSPSVRAAAIRTARSAFLRARPSMPVHT